MNSFGNYPESHPKSCHTISWQDQIMHLSQSIETTYLPIGMRRSYGDSCLNNDGAIVCMTGLNKLMSFDRERGVMICEAGATLQEILSVIVPEGFFLPVTPGTQYITIGGAIANDVHGKNHHRAGSFGNHVHSIGLMRSDHEGILICSEHEHSELFYATIGGLGLTGIIVWAEFSLITIPSPLIHATTEQFHGYAEFQELSKKNELENEYTVSWFDCFSGNAQSLRGLYTSGNFTQGQSDHKSNSLLTIPVKVPEFVLNRYSIALFNELYFRKQITKVQESVIHYSPFFYPLDAIGQWNNLYGKRGFLQYQCVIPHNDSLEILSEILIQMKKNNMGSFLVVLKSFGDIPSKGLLSFPMPGITIAMDFPMRGNETLRLLEQFDGMVYQAGGRVYPAKDARMSPKHFTQWYPAFERMNAIKDPKIESTFWKRMMQ